MFNLQERSLFNHLIISIFIILLSFGVAQAGDFGTAPINPEFLQYVEQMEEEQDLLTPSSSQYACGYVPSPLDFSHLVKPEPSLSASGTFPARYDLRDLGYVTPVRNQDPYGTCWAHSAFAAIESNLLKNGNGATDLSEWHLAYFAYLDDISFTPTDLYDNVYNQGGCDWRAVAVLARWRGAVDESSCPYGVSEPTGNETVTLHLQNAYYLDPSPESIFGLPLYGPDVKQALMDYGAVSISLKWDQTNWSLVFNDTTNSYYNPADGGGGHAVTVVGWDDNYSRDNFILTPQDDGAWIVRNSYGSSWGESGYFYLSYYDPNLKHGVSYVVQPADNYEYVHQYDELGWVGNFGGGETALFANIFDAERAEQVEAISFYNPQYNSQYVISICDECESGNPSSGIPKLDGLSGTLYEPGYHTIDLPTPLPITQGHKFSVILGLYTPDWNYPMSYEYSLAGYSDCATAQPGQSFYIYGENWIDLTTHDPTANFCIKAFTSDEVSISGYIRNSMGHGIEDVSVSIDGRSAVTDGNGFYAFSGFYPGNYTVSCSRAGYSFTPVSKVVNVQHDDVNNVNFTGQILQGFLDISITPLSAVTTGASWNVDGGQSWNGEGTYILPVGDYTVSFKRIISMSTPDSQLVTVEADTTTSVTGVYEEYQFPQVPGLDIEKAGLDDLQLLAYDLGDLQDLVRPTGLENYSIYITDPQYITSTPLSSGDLSQYQNAIHEDYKWAEVFSSFGLSVETNEIAGIQEILVLPINPTIIINSSDIGQAAWDSMEEDYQQDGNLGVSLFSNLRIYALLSDDQGTTVAHDLAEIADPTLSDESLLSLYFDVYKDTYSLEITVPLVIADESYPDDPVQAISNGGNNYFFIYDGAADGKFESHLSYTLLPSGPSFLWGHVGLQGRQAPPHDGWIVPLEVGILKEGHPVPSYQFVETDAEGDFLIQALEAGNYSIGVKDIHTLRNVVNTDLIHGENYRDLGLLREGDSDDNNRVDIVDFSILAMTFNRAEGAEGFDPRADFNCDGAVNILDFSLLAENFNQGGDEIN